MIDFLYVGYSISIGISLWSSHFDFPAYPFLIDPRSFVEFACSRGSSLLAGGVNARKIAVLRPEDQRSTFNEVAL